MQPFARAMRQARGERSGAPSSDFPQWRSESTQQWNAPRRQPNMGDTTNWSSQQQQAQWQSGPEVHQHHSPTRGSGWQNPHWPSGDHEPWNRGRQTGYATHRGHYATEFDSRNSHGKVNANLNSYQVQLNTTFLGGEQPSNHSSIENDNTGYKRSCGVESHAVQKTQQRPFQFPPPQNKLPSVADGNSTRHETTSNTWTEAPNAKSHNANHADVYNSSRRPGNGKAKSSGQKTMHSYIPINEHVRAPVDNQMMQDSQEFRPENLAINCEAAQKWLYPVSENHPVREYQKKISQTAIMHNTLVCLPTGLGKTFVAAVVMYNYFRWFPEGKILFMAPTKPLVHQQIAACHGITGISQKYFTEMTGAQSAAERKSLWNEKRIFFVTPQTVANDMGIIRGQDDNHDDALDLDDVGFCPKHKIVCVVVDEAHRATKEYSYVQVIKALRREKVRFRVLALTATPGANVDAIQHIIDNLVISRIEVRDENDNDVHKYVHTKTTEMITVKIDEAPAVKEISDVVLDCVRQSLNLVKSTGQLNVSDPRHLDPFAFREACDRFRKNLPPNINSVGNL